MSGDASDNARDRRRRSRAISCVIVIGAVAALALATLSKLQVPPAQEAAASCAWQNCEEGWMLTVVQQLKKYRAEHGEWPPRDLYVDVVGPHRAAASSYGTVDGEHCRVYTSFCDPRPFVMGMYLSWDSRADEWQWVD